MDRGLIYPGQVPLETDLLFAQKASMVGLAKLAAAVLGVGTLVNGLATTQTTVPSLAVQVAAGEIYQMVNIDGTAYSSIAADTTHQVLKQGVNLDATTLAITPPGTAGFSINYLIQATFAEVDATPVVLPYYNASNPATAYSGPANAGTTNNTRRLGQVTLSAKAGTAATTGSQITPAPDSGYVGLYVVTVANGAATVVNANISSYAGAPFLNTGMLGQVATLLNTPAQFDNSTKAATTAFANAQGLHFTNANGVALAVNSTLTAAQSGGWFELQAAGLTITMPPLANCPSGLATYTFKANNAFTLKGNGAETISSSVGVNANTLSVLAGETLTVVSNGPGGNWYVVSDGFGGGGFAKSFGATTYQKLPSGLIIQTGSCMLGYGGTLASGTGTQVFTTLPITFPNACNGISCFHNGGVPQAYAAQIVSTSQFATTTTYASSIGGSFIAIGY